MTKIDLLNEYLNVKLRIKPLGEVRWNTEECFDCGGVTYCLQIDDFEPGIKITEGELLDYLISIYNKNNE